MLPKFFTLFFFFSPTSIPFKTMEHYCSTSAWECCSFQILRLLYWHHRCPDRWRETGVCHGSSAILLIFRLFHSSGLFKMAIKQISSWQCRLLWCYTAMTSSWFEMNQTLLIMLVRYDDLYHNVIEFSNLIGRKLCIISNYCVVLAVTQTNGLYYHTCSNVIVLKVIVNSQGFVQQTVYKLMDFLLNQEKC